MPPGLTPWGLGQWALGAVASEGAQGKRVRGGEAPKLDGKEPAEVPGGMVGAETPHKVKVVLRPLDTGRPEEYDGWRYAAKASLVGAGPPPARVMGYLEAVEDRSSYPDDHLRALIRAEADMSTLDARLFSAILGCIGGTRRGALEERLRAQVPFAAGALAICCLDD